VLPATEQPPAVADLRVSRHRADAFVGERLHQTAHRVCFEQRVAVNHDDDLAAAQTHARVERRRLAGVVLAHQTDPR